MLLALEKKRVYTSVAMMIGTPLGVAVARENTLVFIAFRLDIRYLNITVLATTTVRAITIHDSPLLYTLNYYIPLPLKPHYLYTPLLLNTPGSEIEGPIGPETEGCNRRGT